MMRLIIYYVQLDTEITWQVLWTSIKQWKYDVMIVYIICSDKTILKIL